MKKLKATMTVKVRRGRVPFEVLHVEIVVPSFQARKKVSKTVARMMLHLLKRNFEFVDEMEEQMKIFGGG